MPRSFLWGMPLLLAAFLTLGGYCQTNEFDTTIPRFEETSLDNALAGKFSVEYRSWYKVVRNHVWNETYALVCCGQTLKDDAEFTAVINIPVAHVAVDGALDALPFIELLGQQDKVVQIKQSQEVTSPCYANLTDNTSVRPDLVLRSIHAEKSEMPSVGFNADNDQLTPLQKGSWLVYIALFFDLEKTADKIFADIVNRYSCHQTNLIGAPHPRNVAWTMYDSSKKTWSLLKDPFYAQLVADAGASLVQPKSSSENSDRVAEFHADLRNADCVIDVSSLTVTQDQDYDDWLKLAGFTDANVDIYNQSFITRKTLHRTDGLTDDMGYSDWPQRSAARPDLALRDVIHMVYPGYSPYHQYVWLRNFAKQDDSRLITKETYPTCHGMADTIMGDICVYRNFFDQLRSSAPQPPPVSFGALVFAIGVMIAMAVLYRRYYRQTKFQYYPMDDLSSSGPHL
ncbi:uncharacterized protein BYT42DRAFT_562620 [Radiomyces spectabilis]|uniref:uncharacterized protein n=1 Tax=Radiomyces spectabilis TaxID=64574 RepID=UPI00221F5BCF|nr:uncharacterized protein BYT42DRAFT_562620 [Radiomyces spectabilis]KAI8384466.1 hypothetical protein BYT42DRAFT_562620 [Radiomyces spectabilis]